MKNKFEPFAYKDAEEIIGCVITNREYGNFYIITGVMSEGVTLGASRITTFKDLLESYIFPDGTPCGKTVKH